MIVALGMALVIGTEGIDLSVGSVMALAAALIPLYLGYGLVPALLIALLAGLCVGAVNGTLVAVVGLQPIVATLALFVGGRGWPWSWPTASSSRSRNRDLLSLGSGSCSASRWWSASPPCWRCSSRSWCAARPSAGSWSRSAATASAASWPGCRSNGS